MYDESYPSKTFPVGGALGPVDMSKPRTSYEYEPVGLSPLKVVPPKPNLPTQYLPPMNLPGSNLYNKTLPDFSYRTKPNLPTYGGSLGTMSPSDMSRTPTSYEPKGSLPPLKVVPPKPNLPTYGGSLGTMSPPSSSLGQYPTKAYTPTTVPNWRAPGTPSSSLGRYPTENNLYGGSLGTMNPPSYNMGEYNYPISQPRTLQDMLMKSTDYMGSLDNNTFMKMLLDMLFNIRKFNY